MGDFVGWHCDNCGAEESYYMGGGMLGFNDPEVVKLAQAGKLGPAMKALLADGIPDGWTLFNERVFYSCPKCKNVIAGQTVRIDDASGNWLVFHIAPPACSKCGEGLAYWDDKVPMTLADLHGRCNAFVEEGCPSCGKKSVVVDSGSWD